MLNNDKTKVQGVHYSRYIISWINSCKALKIGIYFGDQFEEWLKSEGCTDEEISHIVEIAMCGRMELENSSKNFLVNYDFVEEKEEAK